MLRTLSALPSLRTLRTLSTTPWSARMPASQFDLMRRIISAPSPVGMEASMSEGVLLPHFANLPSNWEPRLFKGNAGLVVDTHPGRDDMLTVMICGHSDKIR